MKPFEINIAGKAIPCLLTMAAMADFKDSRGKDVSEVADAFEILSLIFFCARAAAERAGTEFEYTERSFFNALDPEEAAACINAWTEANMEDSKKKAPAKKTKA